MSKSHARASARRSARVSSRRPPPPDGAVYIGLAMIGVFGIGLWYLVSQTTWTHGFLGYFTPEDKQDATVINAKPFRNLGGGH